MVRAERTLTLVLPKTGLDHVPCELYLADIGIPPGAYKRLGLRFYWPSRGRYCIPLKTVATSPRAER